MKGWNQSFSKVIACATLLLGLISCGGSGSDGGGTTQSHLTVTSGTSFPSGPVRISFSVTNFTIGLPGTPHLRFSVDGGAPHDFYNGAGINSDNGVLLNGVHDHAVHWTSTTSFDLFGLSAGSHQVRLVLVDQNNQELPGASASRNFMVQQPPTGELQLVPVLVGPDIHIPVALLQAPDGRIFYNELYTGKIRIVQPGWLLDSTPFCEIPPPPPSGEQGLLGLTLDPNFSSNHYVYVYYTEAGAARNRVVRYTDNNGVCDAPFAILDTLPVGTAHNGGIIQFGPDGMLYVVIGDVTIPSNAQDLTSLAGKILRVNPANGSGLSDNPFFVLGGNDNQNRVFSYGHRNSYGFTFHPHTNDLWESENGEDDSDEINRIVAGGNYGWPIWRGIVNQPGFVDPIAVFFPKPCDRLIEECVISPTGIIAIPGNSSVYPPAYQNNLLVASFTESTIRLVIPNGTNPDLPGTTSVAYPGGQGALLSLMLGSDGYVYVSSWDPSNNNSGIFRVVPL